ncbi:lytic murein transglycosylase [Nocardioides sp. C4-1]|uniref:lytic transglycosylase domain-containing protein n=1 Tax=Nocardioides sp. C4-1 TaxID=3151851 RepID=UPI0032662290
MSGTRTRQAKKAAALVPLALLSAAWTASITSAATSSPGGGSAGAAASPDDATLPDGSSVPAEAIEAPASVTDSTSTTGSVGGVDGDAEQIVATSSTNGIPSSALAAYQRAETVINAADKACRLSWQLVAAIGRVESDHGRFGGSALDADGIARPDIVGLPLNGKNGTALIRDTDAGQYDGDTAFDRAVGPMQFIPSTWAVVGVDSDNDGVRNPQDIDDAALATAVYLCSGDDDLSTLSGQRAAVYRYNHSQRYVDLVLDVADSYLEGDFTAVPDGTIAAGYLTPNPSTAPAPSGGRGGKGETKDTRSDAEPVPGGDQPSAGTDQPAAPEPAEEEPSQAPPSSGPAPSVPSLPVPSLPPVSVAPLPTTGVQPVDDVLTVAQAIVQCTLDGHVNNLLVNNDPFDLCVKEYTTR